MANLPTIRPITTSVGTTSTMPDTVGGEGGSVSQQQLEDVAEVSMVLP